MERLYIERTKSTPEIDFDPSNNILKISGQSYPENAFKFYEPIFQWVDDYIKEIQGELLIEIEFKMPYINSSSSKCIIMLLDKFQEAFDSGKDIIINWYYDEENESTIECAEEFKEDLTLPFNLLDCRR
ncbi:hypothetical protein CLHOM_18400 [Clostridium homopropionicum DSM 5847]|uniref:SiaC family regulatory phosphoprotein domain-containing protein n=1 Tax=Clostridium homopropionicum DSM 5847 TaxID=1121318 RepID=A0A0L6Z9V5_9CLOT|nr:DUF1987 domain-containing protein [Clostridium homopropionicum]KOA19751.1 hypothetical protein CLHOM_18400 [Clostridium homopropionicum DSM 5847]SFF78309.1 protein of unknown function [Clostridium homopropionicum]